MVDVIPISVALTQSLLHNNNIGVTYIGTSNFKMEPVRFVPLYSTIMLQFMVTFTKGPFVTTPAHIVVSMKLDPKLQGKHNL